MEVDKSPDEVFEDKAEDSLFKQYLFLKSRGKAYSEAGHLLVSLLSQSEPFSAALQSEIQIYTDALLGKNDATNSCLQILALLPDEELYKFFILLIKHHLNPEKLRYSYSLLLGLLKIFPKSLNEPEVVELLLENINLLLEESKKRFSSFCNEYREVFATKLFPYLLVSSKKSELFQVYSRLLPEAVSFFLGCVFTTFLDEETVVSFPESSFQSIFQLINEVCSGLRIRLVEFWPVTRKHASLKDLEIWWKIFKRNAVSEQHSTFRSEVNFLVASTFFGFVLAEYSDEKNRCDTPEWRPFLISNRDLITEVKDQTPKNMENISRKLKSLYNLAVEIWIYLNRSESENQTKFRNLISQLQLEDSSIYMTFRCDLAVHLGEESTFLPSDKHPIWLKHQMISQRINLSTKHEFSQGFFEDICKIISHLRLFVSPSREEVKLCFFSSPGIFYVWNDYNMMGLFCDILLDMLLVSPVNRMTDEQLSVLLIIIQPVLSKHLGLLQEIFTVLLSRQKFVFKQFFDYIVVSEIISQFSLLLGSVNLELKSDVTSVALPVHKTRGVNRESTEALQAELQRHALLMAVNSNSFRIVQTFLRAEKDAVSNLIFSNTKQLNKRGGK